MLPFIKHELLQHKDRVLELHLPYATKLTNFPLQANCFFEDAVVGSGVGGIGLFVGGCDNCLAGIGEVGVDVGRGFALA